jgi:FkbM family methyltransferase
MADRPLTLVDLGARGALDEDLMPLASVTHAIGFEPDQAEAARLSRATGPWRQMTILPYAVGGTDGPGTLHVPAANVGASLLPHNESMIEEFGHEALHRTTARIPVRTRTLDGLLAEGVLPGMDYLKIDVEGAELDVLKGALSAIKHCVAVKVECAFIEQRLGQPVAHETTAYLDESEFGLVDIRDIHRWRRRVLPTHPCSSRFKMPYSRGCAAQADLLFFRKPDTITSADQANAAVLISASLGYFDHAWALTRKFPVICEWWNSRGVNIEAELQSASARMGKAAVRGEIRKALRQLVPLFRSLIGVLPHREPDLPY